MGYIIQLHCSSCGKTEEYYLGCGRKHCDRNNVLSSFDESDRGEAAKYLDRSNWSFERKLVLCKQCHRIAALPSLKLWKADGAKTQEYIPSCKCGGSVRVLLDIDHMDEMPQNGVRCMECGAAMDMEHTGYWD